MSQVVPDLKETSDVLFSEASVQLVAGDAQLLAKRRVEDVVELCLNCPDHVGGIGRIDPIGNQDLLDLWRYLGPYFLLELARH